MGQLHTRKKRRQERGKKKNSPEYLMPRLLVSWISPEVEVLEVT